MGMVGTFVTEVTQALSPYCHFDRLDLGLLLHPLVLRRVATPSTNSLEFEYVAAGWGVMLRYNGGNEWGNGSGIEKNWVGRQWDYNPELYPSGGEDFTSKLGNLSMV